MIKLKSYGYDDRSLERYLLHHDIIENISIIEDILNKDSQNLIRLQKLKDKNRLDFGKTLSKKELKETFPKICNDVNKLLKIEEYNLPSFGYATLFKMNWITSRIFLGYGVACTQILPNLKPILTGHISQDTLWPVFIGSLVLVPAIYVHLKYTDNTYSRYYANNTEIIFTRESKANFVAVGSHEYTHHIHNLKGFMNTEPNTPQEEIFCEGHARSVQKKIVKYYSEKEDNEAINYISLDQNVGELKSTYRWLCRRNKLPLNKHILKTKTSRDEVEQSYYIDEGKPTSHAIGNALFSVCEAREGKEIYSQVLNGDFSFKKEE